MKSKAGKDVKDSDLLSSSSRFSFPFEKDGFRGFLHLSLPHGMGDEKAKDAMSVAADIAHEIRNPLGSIELFASLLRKSLKHEADIRKVEHIMQAVHVINSRITGLIDTMKKKAIRREIVSLKNMINEMIGPPELREAFLTCHFIPADIRVRGDEKLLRHFFLTLIIGLLSGMTSPWRLNISADVQREGNSRYGEVTFQFADDEKKVALTEVIRHLNFPVLHHIIHLHEGFIKLDAQSLTVSIPVET